MDAGVFKDMKTPAYVIDVDKLEENLKVLKRVMDEAGCRILLAQKAFSMYSLYPLIGEYLSGTCASSLNEARLGREEMGKEVHIFSPAYKMEELPLIAGLCDSVVFNNISQLETGREIVKRYNKDCEIGIRVNPEYSEIEVDLYNPCVPGSRFGVKTDELEKADLRDVSGIHFHTLCEQDQDVLERTLQVFEQKFAKYIKGMKWVNFGGGHHITRKDYDVDKLIEIIRRFKDRYGVQVYLEPGEAVALNAGVLVSRVLDVFDDEFHNVILDTSATCHMPDVIEMPYRPGIRGGGKPQEYEYTYRLGGPTCLAGDVIGDYSFKEPLKKGALLVFEDMAIYTMVKNNTFNGVNLPSIAVYSEGSGLKVIKSFGYEDFKSRL